MEWLSDLIKSYHFISALLSGIASFIVWKRVGFKAPGYLHVIAFISGVIGILLAYLGYASGHPHGHKAIWLVIGFPLATYLIFGFYGGGHVMVEREKNSEKKP
jgi:hypothetical protein